MTTPSFLLLRLKNWVTFYSFFFTYATPNFSGNNIDTTFKIHAESGHFSSLPELSYGSKLILTKFFAGSILTGLFLSYFSPYFFLNIASSVNTLKHKVISSFFSKSSNDSPLPISFRTEVKILTRLQIWPNFITCYLSDIATIIEHFLGLLRWHQLLFLLFFTTGSHSLVLELSRNFPLCLECPIITTHLSTYFFQMFAHITSSQWDLSDHSM